MADQRKIIADGEAAPVDALPGGSIAELRERLAAFEKGRFSDKLTGLPDRARLLVQVERVVAGVNYYGTPAALVIIDLEGAWDDEAGEAVVNAARKVAGLVRSTDFAARIAETTFAVILDLDHNSAIETSERIARCLAGTPRVERVWLGVAAILKGDGPDDVMQRAELNLSRARDER